MDSSNLLFESIFNRPLSEAGTREYLTAITIEHPYFSPAQFFLLLSLDKSAAGYAEQAAKTSILFNNPYWLQFQLQEIPETNGKIPVSIVEADHLMTEEKLEEQSLEIKESAESTENIEPAVAENIVSDEPDSLPATQTDEQLVTESDDGEPQQVIENGVVEKEVILPVTAAGTEPDTQNTGSETQDEANVSQSDGNTEERTTEQIAATVFETRAVAITVQEEKNLPGQAAAGTEQDIATNKSSENEPAVVPGSHFNNDRSPLVNEPENDNTEDNTELENQPLNFKLNIDTSGTTEETIAFEPLHTSDYFASLGIKLSGEIKSTDKLGKQLKSFTEWLKTMKKIHSNELPPLSGQADLSIQKLAEQSNREDAVVTEAMADVLLQQDKIDKAIEVYKKLSLLNPSKSAYFAAKINQLKEH